MIEEIPDSRWIKVKIWLCHTEGNLNGSYFSKELLENMKDNSLANIPILGYISKDSFNETDFNGHEERLIIEDGEVKIEYIGKIYGLIPESHNAQFEFKLCDDGVEREFLTCEGLLYTRFPECIDIFNRDEVKSQSMELEPDSISGKFELDNLFHFETAKFEGACVLGDSLTPAMVNSTIEKFSIKSIKDQLQEMIVELNNTVFYKNNQEGGIDILTEKFELIKQYENLTEEDVLELKINHEQYSLEDFDMKLKELSGAKDTTIPSTTDFTSTTEDELKVFTNKEIEEVKTEIIAEYELKVKEVQDKLNTTTIEYSNLNAEFESLKNEFEEYKNNYSTINSEVIILQDFKLQTETKQQEAFELQQSQLKTELIENFSKVLSAEEIQSITDQNLSVEDMDKEFKLMFASKELSTKFSKKTKKTDIETEIPIVFSKKTNNDSWTSCIKKEK